MAQAVFLDLATVDRGDLDRAALLATADRWQLHALSAQSDVAHRIDAAEIVVTNKVVLDRDVIGAAPRLRLICIAATGTNNVDLEAARAHGVAVANARGYATPSVVQHVFGLILALSTRLGDYRQAVARGDWQRATATDGHATA